MKEKTCCFFGHREINETEELKLKLIEIIEKLICEKQVDTFLFGSKSQFNETVLPNEQDFLKRYLRRPENYPELSAKVSKFCFRTLRSQAR